MVHKKNSIKQLFDEKVYDELLKDELASEELTFDIKSQQIKLISKINKNKTKEENEYNIKINGR